MSADSYITTNGAKSTMTLITIHLDLKDRFEAHSPLRQHTRILTDYVMYLGKQGRIRFKYEPNRNH